MAVKLRIRRLNPFLSAIALGAMLLLVALYAGDAFRFVYQAY